MLKVLIVDDNPAVTTALDVLFDLHGMPTLVAKTPSEALDYVATEDIGVVVQDMNFRRDATSGDEGVALMRAIRRLDPDVPILMMTAFTSLSMAVALVKEGASDYIAKPWDDDKLVVTVKNLMRLRALEQENLRLRSTTLRAQRAISEAYDTCGLVYQSAAMHEAVMLAVKVARSDAPVFITGPNGSGKEKLAEIVRANSRRHDKPFVKVNAGGLPETLLEAELFGAEAGAFTGATKTRVGRFEEAENGTLFLDEVGNLSLAGQMKLLRVLQTGDYQRLGSSVSRQADVRLVSATNANLPQKIREGSFREDLYFRLNVIEIAVPRLVDRVEDIALLATHFVGIYARESENDSNGGNSNEVRISPEARRALLDYDWPGNVRELENRIQRAVLVRKGATILPEDLGLAAGTRSSNRTPSAGVENEAPEGPLTEQERHEIERALVSAKGVVSRAAAMLGLSRQALYRKMEKLRIGVERRLKL